MLYDLIIIGTGPGGMNAAIYAARYKLNVLVLGEIIGGTVAEAYDICNFITYNEIKGFEFANKMREQVERLDVEIKLEKVIGIKKGKNFEVKTEDNKYMARKIIIATGTEKKRLNLDNEKKFLGKGISYCAVCDGAIFRDKITAVIGGGNSALTSALLLAEFAKEVYIIYRRNKFIRAEPTWVDIVNKSKKIKKIFNANIVKLIGKDKLEKIKLDNNKELKLDGLFVEIGALPRIELVKRLGVRLDKGYIKVNNKQETSVKGIYAVGDVTNNNLKQIIVAAAEGAVASTSIYKELM